MAVGFNRRFSPHGKKIRELLAGRSGPAAITMLVNAGTLPDDHWLLDPQVGGGRIIGEGCHWFDLMSFVLDQPIVGVSARPGNRSANRGAEATSVTLRFADGSQGTLHYFAQGHRAFPKERMTVFCDGRVLEVGQFSRMWGWGWPGFRRMNLFRQDKGHLTELRRICRANCRRGPAAHGLCPISKCTESTLAAAELKSQRSPS